VSAFNFKAQFAEAVESGAKRQTIRAMRKNLPKVGERAHLFTGMRTKQCRRLRAGHEDRIKRVERVHIAYDILVVGTVGFTSHQRGEQNSFARKDGFKDMAEMREWFRAQHGLPFNGFMVEW